MLIGTLKYIQNIHVIIQYKHLHNYIYLLKKFNYQVPKSKKILIVNIQILYQFIPINILCYIL